MISFRSIIAVAFLCSFFFSCTDSQHNRHLSADQIGIIPKPTSIVPVDAAFKLKKDLVIYYTEKGLSADATYLKNKIEELTGYETDTVFSISPKKNQGAIILAISKDIPQEEGYHLTIEKNISISGKTTSGVFYGIQTLYQILYQCKQAGELPGLKIDDHPRFSWRGMHLDVSRHFFDKAFIKKYIDLLALHKMNTFHWHLVDDQGWRIEIKKYPKLTEKGAWRVDREELPWDKRPAQQPGEQATYGGYYTQDDVKEIVAYAAERHVNIVPEIEMPAHVSSALAAYPEYSCSGKAITVPPGGVWPITDIYCAGNEQTFHFIEDVLTEVMQLFPSKFIHIGGDEADKTAWKSCPKCQARIKTERLKNEHELQSYFIKRIDKFLTDNGRRLIGWDEILEGGLAQNAAVMSWRGEQGGIEAAEMKHDVVMTPTAYCYFDYYQSMDKDLEPKAFGGFIDVAKVYNYEPVPAQLSPQNAQHVLGAQANIWTEYISTGDHVEHMALPRMTALSEVVWTDAGNKNYDDFQVRLESFLNLLADNNFNYFIPTPENLLPEMIFTDSVDIALKTPWPFGKIYYTLDGSEPNRQSPVYNHPVTITDDTVIKAVYVLDNGRKSKVKTGRILKKTPLGATNPVNPQKGVSYDYYEGPFTSVKQLNDAKVKRSGTLETIELPEAHIEDGFGLSINGLIDIQETGIFTFKLVSDDGSQLLIDDHLVVDADGLHGPEPRSGQVALEKGFHKITVKYFESGGGQMLESYIQGPKQDEQLIPREMLFHIQK